jgi:hypothetical protein
MPPNYETIDIVVDDNTIAAGDLAKILEPVWWRATIYEGPEEYERSLQQFSPEQRLMFALRWYLAEVSNGGHRQFYGNSTGIVWIDAAHAFDALGLDEGVRIVTDSAERLGGNPSLDRERRQRQIERHAANFRDLDERLYSLKKDTDLERAMLDYIREDASAFHFSGPITRVVLPTRTPRASTPLPPIS